MVKLALLAEAVRPYISKMVQIVFYLFFVVSLAIFFVHGMHAVLHPYPLDYGEAPLIDQAARLAAGQNIYRVDLSTPPYTIANYPPLYVISLIPFLYGTDSPFQMARAISLIATLFSATFIGLTIWTLGSRCAAPLRGSDVCSSGFQSAQHRFFKSWFAALVAVSCFIVSPYVMLWSSLARIDSLALAFATGAIFIFSRWPRSGVAWVGGGLLLVAAAYTRQSYLLAAPLAGFIWLWVHNKWRAIALALFVAGLTAILFAALNTLTNGGFYYNIVTANVNDFIWERLANRFRGLLRENSILLSLGGFYLIAAWRTRDTANYQNPWFLVATFLVGAVLSGSTIGKIGSNVNYFLELSAAMALVAGAAIIWLRSHPWGGEAVLLLIVVQLGLLLQSALWGGDNSALSQRRQDLASLRLLEEEVRRMEKPILADEYMGMLTMNKQPLYMQPFEVTQLSRKGMWDQRSLLKDIESKAFGGILIHHYGARPLYRHRWTVEMLEYIEKHYRPVKTLAGTVIFIPRGQKEVPSAPESRQN